MKIIEIVFHLASGGVERFVVDLANELAKTEDVTLLMLRDEKIDEGNGCFFKNLISSEVKYDNLGLQPGLGISVWWNIWRYIRKQNPDIVHFHGEGMPYWMSVPIALSSRKIKFYQTIHNDIHHKYDKGIYKKFYVPLFVTNGRVRMISLSKSNYSDLMDVYPNAFATCIANGRSPIEKTELYDSVKREINTYRVTKDTVVLLHIARYNKQKNQARLVRCLNQLVSEGLDITLIVVGGGFDCETGNALQQASCDRIHYVGKKTNVSDYLLLSDIFCLSSDHEGMPITLIESLLSGTPAVSTPVCGAIDAIQNGVNGMVASDFSDEAYCLAIKKTLECLPEITQKTNAMISSSPYGIETCAKHYLEYFNN